MTKRETLRWCIVFGNLVTAFSYLWFLLANLYMPAFWLGCAGFGLATYGFVSYAISEG